MSTPPQFVGTPSEVERLQSQADLLNALARNISCNLRVALPGIIASFDADKQTATIDLAIQDRIVLNGVAQYKQFPTLTDVPIVLPRAGGFTLTMPVKKGDECLVVFADMCMNAWFSGGPTESPQGGYVGAQHERPRRHSLSDAFAIVGTWSQPRKLTNYSADKTQLRSDDGNTFVEVGADEITIKATTVTIQAETANINASDKVNVTASNEVVINGSGHTTIEGKDWLTHAHSGVQSGGSTTGPVV